MSEAFRYLAAWKDRWWLALPVLTVLLLAPTLLHGKPFVFWDTAQYYEYGAKLSNFALTKLAGAPKTPPAAQSSATEGRAGTQFEAKGTGIAFYGARSAFYSVWLYAIIQTLGIWAAPFTQAAAIAWLIWRIATHTRATNRLAWAASAAGLASLGAGGHGLP